ncbi:MAG: beta-N-acetylglucosaminidase [Flavobacteriales bacterium]|nr:beta-N-acetylglucosaminidase [Flavobacteriales bacterium]
MKYFYKFLFLSIFLFFGFSKNNDFYVQNQIPYLTSENIIWSDSVLNTLSIDQKIAQLFMVVGTGKGLGESYYQEIDSLITNYQIGGVIFLQSSPNKLKNIINRYNDKSSIPLLTSIDAEWGLGMRLDSVQSFPWMMTLGAIQNKSLIYDFGCEVAKQLNELGIHINFAPVIDVNNNPNNPIIDRRAFSSNPQSVALSGVQYMYGLQDNNVLACAKHFPGHGDTDIDSHKSLPVLFHNKNRLDSIELKPFRYLINRGLGSVMIAHINLPLIDTLDIPSSLSSYLIKDILKNEMNFKGLVVSDALNMNALSNYNSPGERELNAFLAGNDILLCPDNIAESINIIKKAIYQNPLLIEALDESCRKILMIKKWAGAFNDIKKNNFNTNTRTSELLNYTLSKNAITILKNKSNLLPLKNIKDKKMACVLMGEDSGDLFYQRLNNYLSIDKYNLDEFEGNKLLDVLKSYDLVIVGMHFSNNNFWEKHTLSNRDSIFISNLNQQNKTIISVFGHPRIINSIDCQNINSLILAYQNSNSFQDLVAQVHFGSIGANGRLSTELNNFKFGCGLNLDPIRDFGFVLPEECGVNFNSLEKVDSLVQDAISQGVMPGCQVVASRFGKIFYNKSFGFHTYDSLKPVEDADLYDIASITKIASAAPILIKLHKENKIKLNKKIRSYYAKFKNSEIQNLKIIDILSHQAQLFPWIPFWEYFMDVDNKLDENIFSNLSSEKYDIQIAENLFFNKQYIDTMYSIMCEYPLLEKKEYKYSDLGFYLLKPIIESKLSLNIEDYLQDNIYDPIEAFRITYNPIDKTSLNSIIPTEKDTHFRNQLVHGYVHDQGAALLGGVSLHAGLFSNAIDLMKLMQLYLDDGFSCNQQILSKKSIQYFTTSHFTFEQNRRGVIFDKPSIDSEENGPTCDSISHQSYGHTGFTGTMVWADPTTNLIYVFLSNGRVYPSGNNTLLLEKNIRTEIQKLFYQSISH